MEYRKLGRTGLPVGEIAYGSWVTFGNQIELDQARKILRRAFDLGINYIDTADVYERGKAEEFLGEVLPEFNRRGYIIATKVFWPMSDSPIDRGLSRKHIIDSLTGSLERLKLKYVDIFYCHRWDPDTPLEETLSAMEDLVRQGKTVYWGTSEWEADQIAEACALCRARGWHPPVVNQPRFSLLSRGIEKRILPASLRFGMGTAAFSPLAQGILTGKYSGGEIPPGSRASDDRINRFIQGAVGDRELLDRVDRLKPLASKYGLSLARFSLAWALQNPGITSLIVGATSVGQLEENVSASGVRLDTADLAEVDRLFPV